MPCLKTIVKLLGFLTGCVRGGNTFQPGEHEQVRHILAMRPPSFACAQASAKPELLHAFLRVTQHARVRPARCTACSRSLTIAGCSLAWGSGSGKKVRKSSGKALAQLRVAVELPLAADTSVAVAAMVNGACGGGIVGTAVYGDAEVAAYAASKSDGKVEHVSIDQALISDGCDLARGDGAVALVGVNAEDQIGSARRIAELSGARPIVAVNVEWEHAGDGGVTFKNSRGDDGETVTADEVFANSFSVVYSYLPLAIQGLMGATQEGAVFKCVRGGAPEGSPWRILVKDDKGAYQQVGAMQRRPEQEDLESALYNAAAAQSPVNKGIGVFKGLADKAKDSIPNPFAGLGGGDKK